MVRDYTCQAWGLADAVRSEVPDVRTGLSGPAGGKISFQPATNVTTGSCFGPFPVSQPPARRHTALSV